MPRRYLHVWLLLQIATIGFAQSTSGTLTGVVTDKSGAAVPNVFVESRDTARNRSLKVQTTQEGNYAFASVTPGIYDVRISAPGFKSQLINGVEVRTAQTTTQNIQLQIGDVSESVSVSGEAPLLNPNSAAVSTTVQNNLLQSLPMNDRAALSAVLLTPGSQGDPQYAGGVQSELPSVFTQAVTPGASITVGGGRPGGGSILVDGSDVTSAGNPRAVMTFSSDVIEEVVVQANGIPAQYGRTSGGIINQSTKSGSNKFHGAFSWAHNDPFFETPFLSPSPYPPAYRYDAFSGAVGGPVVLPKFYNGRNKTFFWAAGEPQRQNLAIGASRTRLPTADELRGNFNNVYDFLDPTLRSKSIDQAIASPIRTNNLVYHYALNAVGFPIGNELAAADRPIISGNDLSRQLASNPLAQKILKTIYPFTPGKDTPYIHWLRPDGQVDIDGNNAIWQRGVKNSDNRYSVKLDQLIGNSDRLGMRYSFVPVQGIRYDWAGPGDPSSQYPQDKVDSYNAGVTYNHIVSSAITSELRMTYSRGDAFRGPVDAALSQDYGAALGLVPANLKAGFPSLLGRGNNGEGRTLDVNFGFGGDVSIVRGAHVLKMGGEHRRIQLNRLAYTGLTGGTYNFAGSVSPNTGSFNGTADQIAGLILGSVNNYSANTRQSNAYYRWKYTAMYLQDDWKIKSKLTLNIGLRWDVETPRTEKYDRQAWFDPTVAGSVNGQALKGGIVFAGTGDRQRGLFPMNYSGFQPRVGLAYAAKSWLVARASYSLLRAPITGYGNALSPDTNISPVVNSASRVGGVQADTAVNLLTNPIAIVTPARLGTDPVFFMNNTNTFAFSLIPQNNAMPTVHKWNASFQIQLRNNLSIEIGYDGSKGTHLYSQQMPQNAAALSITAPLAAAGADFGTSSAANNLLGIRNSTGALINGTLLQKLRPYPQFFNTSFNTDYDRSGNSSYNALNIGLQKRYSSGLTLLASYSWSKSLDDGAPTGFDIFGSTNFQTAKREKSYSEFDMPNKFRSSFLYELPVGKGKMLLGRSNKIVDAIVGGFNLSGTFTAQQGWPGVVYLANPGYFVSTVGTGSDGWVIRPNVLSGVPLINPTWRESPFTRSYYNPAAFAIPGGVGNPQIGNMPRTLNDGRSPSTWMFDTSLSKNIKLARDGKVKVQLRADAFNVLNHPVLFLNPNGRNNGLYSYVASSKTYVANTATTGIDPNNTGQYGNYAGRSFRLGARLSF